MKRLSLLLSLVVAIGLNAFGQQQKVYQKSFKTFESSTMKKRNIELTRDDTLFLLFHDQPCDTSFALYSLSSTDGFLSGHNTLLDSSVAESWAGGGAQDSIFGFYAWFGSSTFTSTTQNIHAKLWNANGTGGSPGTELATVDITHKQISDDIDSGFFTLALFPHAVLMPAGGKYFVGFKMDYKKVQGHLTYDSHRAVGLVNPLLTVPDNDTVLNDCSDDSLENNAWVQLHYTSLNTDVYDGKWYPYWTAFGVATRNQIFPIVLVHSGCTVTVSPTSATVCKKKAVTLTASGGSTYTWAPSTGLNVTTGAVVSAKPNSTTTYTVTANGGACSATVTVTVNPQPTTNVTQDACSNHHILLHANANPNTGVKYQWLLNGSKITGATLSTYSAGTSGSYKVKVTIIATNCVKTSAAVTVTINCKESDVTNFAGTFDAAAYPNPFTKSVSVSIATGSLETATVSLMDFSGRTLNIFKDVDTSVPFEISEDLSPGVYFIKVAQGSNEKMIKVVKSE